VICCHSMAVAARLNVFVDVDDDIVICWYVGDIGVVGLQPLWQVWW